MSLEEAKKVAKKDAIVLVAKQDLENPDCNTGFIKKKFGECHSILEEAATIAKAKALLMERNSMTEEEAHRYLQKHSMDNSTNMVETAQMVLTMMQECS